MKHKSSDAITDYLQELLTDTPSPVEASTDLASAKKEELQALLNAHFFSPENSAPVDTSSQTEQPVFVPETSRVNAEKPAATESEKLEHVNPESSASIPSPIEHPSPVPTPANAVREYELMEWAENGRPLWAQTEFDALLLQVAGLTLAVPLIALGHIYPLTAKLAAVPNQAEWFMGLHPTPIGLIRTINTALLVMPERYDPKFLKSAKYLVTIDGLDWGLAVDSVRHPSRLTPDDVTWRKQRSQRPWLAGTIKSAMCALLDIAQLGQLLQSQGKG
jgi:purine-binding chemotaxis protein CheW